MTAPNKQSLGRQGEEAAALHLQRLGYRVLERNVRLGRGELDLVARDGDTLVFVEVKTRQGEGYGHPAEAVTAAKRAQLRALAATYLKARRLGEPICRFDVAAVLIGPGGRPIVEHIIDAF